MNFHDIVLCPKITRLAGRQALSMPAQDFLQGLKS